MSPHRSGLQFESVVISFLRERKDSFLVSIKDLKTQTRGIKK